MKFIHLSNIRLDRREDTGFPEIPAAEERWQDFQNVINACVTQEADALFITGNLFDGPPLKEQLQRADECLAVLKDTRVFYLTGKADAPEDPPDILNYVWQSPVTVFAGDSVHRIYLPKEDAEITAVGYSKKTWDKIDMKALTRGRKGALQILLLPFLLGEESAEGLNDLAFDFDYIGTGQKVMYKGNGWSRIFSPGCFSPEGFSSGQSHGFFLCTLVPGKKDSTSLTRQFVQGVKREYVSLNATLTPDLSLEEVQQQLGSMVERLGKDNYYRIILEGAMPYSVMLREDRLKEVGLVRSVEDRTDLNKTVEGLKTCSDDAVSRFARALFPDEGDPQKMNALKFGLMALTEQPEEDR